MLVLDIQERAYQSKTGQVYRSYRIKYGVEKDHGFTKALTEYSVNLNNSRDIDALVKSGKIHSYEELKGKEVVLMREIPAFLQDFEIQYKTLNADRLFLSK